LALGTGAPPAPTPVPCPATPLVTAACLVDGVLTGGATVGKSGYQIDTAGQNPLPAVTFISQAGPIVYNRSGLRQFCAVEDGVLHANPNTGGNSLLPTFAYNVCANAAAPWQGVGQ